MEFILLGLYGIALVVGMKKNVRLAVGVFILSLPTYLIRVKVGHLPTTMLELGFGAIVLGWLLFYARTSWPVLKAWLVEHRWFVGTMLVFLLASFGSIFVSDMAVASLGQWRAYFLEPMVFFLILISLRGRQTPPNLPLSPSFKCLSSGDHPRGGERGGSGICATDLVWFLAFSTLSISVYAIVQQFTGWGIATAEWTNPATRRVTAFFTSPNAVALYIGPIVMLALGWLYTHWPTLKQSKKLVWPVIACSTLTALNFFALLFTKSQGGFVALAAGITLFAYLVGYKKSALTVAAGGIILLAAVLLLPRVLPVHYQSGGNRLWLWSHSISYLTLSPQHFVLGTGIRQFFRKIQKPFYNPKQMERLIYPHNIFLNFWTEIGLFGMLAFMGMLGNLIYLTYRVWRCHDKIGGAGLLAVLTVLVVHGFIDVPYFKNDLAMEFWVICALVFFSANPPVIARSEERTTKQSR